MILRINYIRYIIWINKLREGEIFDFLRDLKCSTLNKGIGIPQAVFDDMHHSRLFFNISRKSE